MPSDLLILPVDQSLDPRPLLAPVREAVSRSVATNLQVLLVSPPERGLFPAPWKALQRLLGAIYSCAVQSKGEEAVLGGWGIDVLFSGLDRPEVEERRWAGISWDTIWRVEGDERALPRGLPSRDPTLLPPLREAASTPAAPTATDTPNEVASFPVVALGGSFDHLHPGHKILLSTALSIATRKIIVGVSDAALLTKKAFAEQLEPLQTRLARTERFCRLFRPGLEEYHIVAIQDVYGPTATEADVQALVLSQETTAGGAAVDQKRLEAGLPSLQTFVINVISAAAAPFNSSDGAIGELLPAVEVEKKMSSTQIRRWLAEHPPVERGA